MEKAQIQMKTLLSKDGEELGKILRVDERSGYDGEIEYLYVIKYRVNRLIKRILELPMKSYPPIEVTAESVSIGIHEDDFELLIKQYEANLKLKIKAAKFGKVKKTDEAMARTYRANW